MMPEISLVGVLIVAAVAFVVPLALGLLPALRVPSVVVEIVAGIVIGAAGQDDGMMTHLFQAEAGGGRLRRLYPVFLRRERHPTRRGRAPRWRRYRSSCWPCCSPAGGRRSCTGRRSTRGACWRQRSYRRPPCRSSLRRPARPHPPAKRQGTSSGIALGHTFANATARSNP